MPTQLVGPHGGTLVNRIADPTRGAALRERVGELPKITLSAKQACDLEMIATGAFSPLTGFCKSADFTSICQTMRFHVPEPPPPPEPGSPGSPPPAPAP